MRVLLVKSLLHSAFKNLAVDFAAMWYSLTLVLSDVTFFSSQIYQHYLHSTSTIKLLDHT